jgi:hypothetical protein
LLANGLFAENLRLLMGGGVVSTCAPLQAATAAGQVGWIYMHADIFFKLRAV